MKECRREGVNEVRRAGQEGVSGVRDVKRG